MRTELQKSNAHQLQQLKNEYKILHKQVSKYLENQNKTI